MFLPMFLPPMFLPVKRQGFGSRVGGLAAFTG
jgi:hypothetical protein